jgi:hypothetical protein
MQVLRLAALAQDDRFAGGARMTDLQEALRMTGLKEMRHPALVKNEAVRELSQ